MARLRNQADERLAALHTLLVAWQNRFEDTAITLAQAIKEAGESGDLFDAFAAYCRSGRPDAKQLGCMLRREQGRMVNGRAFVRWEINHDGVVLWKVGTAEEVVDVDEQQPEQPKSGSAQIFTVLSEDYIRQIVKQEVRVAVLQILRELGIVDDKTTNCPF